MPDATPPEARLGGWAAFRHRDFRLYAVGRFLGGLAMQMQNVALGWFVYDLTRSPLALGLVGLATFLPAVACSLVTGHVADAYDRRLVVTVANAILAVAAAGLVLLTRAEQPSVAPIYALAVLIGTARAFGNPASQAMLPSLVPRALFGNAVAWNASIWQTSSVAGPAAGGLLYALGPATVFGVVAGAFGLTALLTALLAPRPGSGARTGISWASLAAGFGFIRSRPVILGAISLDLAAVLLGGATALLPIFAQEVLHVGPLGLGLLRSTPAAGGILMAILLAHRPLERRAGARMLWAVALFGLAIVGFGLSTNVLVSMACLFTAGGADMISVYVRQTLVQGDTPDDMRGRVAAVNTVFIGASNELGEFESGAVAALVGAVPAAVVGGLGTILVALLWSRLFPALRDRDRLIERA